MSTFMQFNQLEITARENNYNLVVDAGEVWREKAKRILDARSDQTREDHFDLLFCRLMPELFLSLGLEKLTIGSWGVLDNLGMDDLEGPEYWDETALLYPCMMRGWTVRFRGPRTTDQMTVQGDQIIDVLIAAEVALTGTAGATMIQQIELLRDEQTVVFVCS